MNPIGTKQIQTERLLIRPFQVEDAPAMFKNWSSNAEVTKYLTWPPHESVETTKKSLRRWVDGYQNPLQFSGQSYLTMKLLVVSMLCIWKKRWTLWRLVMRLVANAGEKEL